MTQRLLLIRPNSTIESAPPPLGLMYIAAYLRKEVKDVEIKIIDARLEALPLYRLAQRINKFKPDYIGITSLHVDSLEAHRVAQACKDIDRSCKVIMGGPYVTAEYLRTMRDKYIDFCVPGEGEFTFAELIRALKEGLDIAQIKGIIFRNNGNIFCTDQREPISDLDQLPFPAWDLINLEEYFYGKKRTLENPMQIYRRAVPIFSSRGCPFRCIYCHDIFGKKFRSRSPENIINEIKYLISRYQIKEIEFLDDTFNFDVNRAKKICELIISEKISLKISFSNGMRVDLVDPDLLSRLKRAGVYRINYGIESASERIQAVMKKKLSLDIVRDTIEETVKEGIVCGGFFMFGFPTETEDEIMQTIDFAVKSKLHTAVFAIVTSFPGTEIYNMAKGESRNTDIEFSTVGKVSLNVSLVSSKKLNELLTLAYSKFYISFFRILRIWRIAPRKLPLFENFWEVLKVVFLRKELFCAKKRI